MSRYTLRPISCIRDHEEHVRERRCLLVDVRERHEFEAGHLPEALSLPLSQLEGRCGELDRSCEVMLYCRTSNRARRAADLLVARGFDHVVVLEGGYTAWTREHCP